MKLNDFAKEIKAKNSFIKASIGGFAGSCKTRTACELILGAYEAFKCTKPVLIIDNEKGSRFLIPFFEKAGIKTLLKDTIELEDTLKAFEYLSNGEIDFLFIDSLTKVWYKYVRDYKKINKRTFMYLQDWGKLLPAWQEDFSDIFVETEGNCIFTGRGGFTYDLEMNEETQKKEFVKSGIKMKMAGETPFEPDLNIWMDINQKIEDNKPIIWREALIIKDRSGLIDGKTFHNPTYKDFKPVIDYLLKVPKGNVEGKTFDTNKAPSDLKDFDKKQNRQIELEKIKALFDKASFSSSKEDKSYKVMIAEKIFNTSSWIELEKYELKKLIKCRENLESFFKEWNNNEDKYAYIETFDLINEIELKVEKK